MTHPHQPQPDEIQVTADQNSALDSAWDRIGPTLRRIPVSRVGRRRQAPPVQSADGNPLPFSRDSDQPPQ